MALTSIPPFTLYSIYGPSSNTLTIDGADESVNAATQIPIDGTLTHIVFHTGTVTTGATIEGKISTVSSSGRPTTTDLYTNSNGTLVVNSSDDNVPLEIPINGGTGVTVTGGDPCFIRIKNPNSSPGTMQIVCAAGNDTKTPYGTATFPTGYADLTTPGTYAWSNLPNIALRYTTTGLVSPNRFGMIGLFGSDAYNSTSTPDERGNRFIAPMTMRATGAVVGLLWSSAGNFRVMLRNSSGTELASTPEIDGDILTGDTASFYQFSDPVTLTSGSEYWITLMPTTSTNVTLYKATTTSTNYMVTGGQPDTTYGVTLTNGAFAAYQTTTRCYISPIIDQIDVGAGGLAANPIRGFLA